MPDIIGRAAVEIAQLFSPLRVALEDGDELAIFLRRFGLPIGGEHVASIGSSLSPLRDGVVGLIDAAQDALADGVDAADVAALVDAAGPLFNTVQSIGPSVSSLAGAVPSGPAMQPFDQVVAGFPDELLDLLLADYLERRIPSPCTSCPCSTWRASRRYRRKAIRCRAASSTFAIISTGSASRSCSSGRGNGRSRRTAGERTSQRHFIAKLMRVFEAFGGAASLDEMRGAEVQVFLPDWPEPTRPPLKAFAPVIRKEVVKRAASSTRRRPGKPASRCFPFRARRKRRARATRDSASVLTWMATLPQPSISAAA